MRQMRIVKIVLDNGAQASTPVCGFFEHDELVCKQISGGVVWYLPSRPRLVRPQKTPTPTHVAAQASASQTP